MEEKNGKKNKGSVLQDGKTILYNLHLQQHSYLNDDTHIMMTDAPYSKYHSPKQSSISPWHDLHFTRCLHCYPIFPTPSSSSYLQWSLLTHLATGLCCAFPNDELCISRCQFEKCNYHSDKADGLVLSGICCACIKWSGIKQREFKKKKKPYTRI